MSVDSLQPTVRGLPEGRVVDRSVGGSTRGSETQSTATASCSPFSEPTSPQSTTASSAPTSPSESPHARPSLLDMDAVYDLHTLDLLLDQFESVSSAPHLVRLLPELLKRPLALELVLAATDAPARCIRKFPYYNVAAFFTALNGCFPALIRRLADAPLLPALAFAFDRETNFKLGKCRTEMLAALDALRVLQDATFSSNFARDVEDDEDEDTPFKTRQKQGNKKRAQRAGAARASTLDPVPFRTLCFPVPTSGTEADHVANQILGVLGSHFEDLLDSLSMPECVNALKDAYITPTSSPVDELHEESPATQEEGPVGAQVLSVPAGASTVPVKAALYFESVKELGPWRIIISSRADRNLRELRRGDAKMFKIVMKKMKELSEGHFSQDNMKRLTGKETAVPIYEAKMTSDTRLVYQIDCITDYGEIEIENQVIRIFGIYTHAQLSRGDFWNSAGIQLARRGAEYRRRCTFRNAPVIKGDYVVTPASFPAMPVQDDKVDAEFANIAIPQEDLDELHALLVLEKFVTFSQALLNSIIANVDVTHPFQPSPYEKKIIEHPYSSYVLGRSGTGKTTTMLFKMLGRERAWRLQQDAMRKPRQLFVTQSRILAGKVEDFFRKLYDSLEVSDQRPKELQNRDPASSTWKNDAARHDDLLDVDDDDNYGSNLPTRFSELEDAHFPLFTTYDQLCKLIEADVEHWLQSVGPKSALVSPVTPSREKRNLVSYTVFQSAYWPHFAEHLTKGLDPALVYSEIMGVIKGSEEALLFPDRQLDQAAYENFSSRRQSTFASHRKRVHDIFSAYTRQKRSNAHFDAADRTHSILKAVQANKNILGRRIDYLYVDEAQDNLLIDALLLRSICSNPQGLFWAGDTAQTISVGSSFRFNDLKAFLHRVEEKHNAEACIVTTGDPPALFQLAVNYRSHGGIISLASTVITLISTLWPDSIDHLAEERGVVDGAKPVFFAAWDESTVRYEQFLFGSGHHEIEFGARQCIIVRTEEAQIKLRKEVGEIGVIMTVYESKGLEFDDVLLYNFFEDSSVTLNQWRVVLNSLTNEDDRQAAPRFDPIRHAGVCAELKSLYVAITRARKNMWIVDRSEKGEPMRRVWTSRNLVQICTPNTDVPHLAVSSTREEWAEQAKSLFKAKRYLQARHCFQRAEQPHKAGVADAYYLRDCARAKVVSASKRLQDERSDAYMAAARAFVQCAMVETSGSNERERSGYYRRAGECYEEAGKHYFGNAAECFERAAEHADTRGEHENLCIRAAKLYREATNFDDAVRVIQTYKLADNQDGERIITAARLFYFSRDDIRKGCLLFEEPTEAVEYLEDRGLDIAQAAVLEHMGRWAEAAEVHLQEGRMLLAAERYLKDGTQQSAVHAREVITRSLWEQIAFGRDPGREDENVICLVTLISQLRRVALHEESVDEITFFEILISRDLPGLRKFAESTYSKQWAGSERIAGSLLLALHIIFKNRRSTGVSTEQLIVRLEMMLAYMRLLRDRMSESNPTRNPFVQQLFGFRAHGERRFIVLHGTYLDQQLAPFKHLVRTDDGTLIMEHDLEVVYKRGLLVLVRDQIKQLDDLRTEKRALDEPCLQLFLFGGCTRADCVREHVSEDAFTARQYNMRVRAHMLALAVLGAVDGLVDRTDIVRQERLWSNMLYESLRPFTRKMGDPSMLDLSASFPTGMRGQDVLHSWIRPHLYGLNSTQRFHLTSAMQCAWMCFTYNNDASAASNIMYNAPLLKDQYALRMDGTEDAPLVLQFMLHAVQAPPRNKTCFLNAIDFLSYVLDARVAVDMAVLCDALEDVISSLVMSWHLGSPNSRRSVTLPRNWCLAAMRHRFANRQTSVLHLGRLVNVCRMFIAQVLEPQQTRSALYYRGVRPTTLVSNIMVGRICNALCIFGYNFDIAGVQNPIVDVMRVLPKRPKSPYEVYAFARGWSDLAQATERSLHGSKLDCLVRIARRKFHQSSPLRENVTNVLFSSFLDLEQQLRDLVPGQPPRPIIPAGVVSTTSPVSIAPADVSTELALEPTGGPEQTLAAQVNTDTILAEDDDAPGDVDEVVEQDDDAPPEVVQEDTPERHAAARLIQRHYRQKRSRENSLDKSSGNSTYFSACVSAVGTLPIPLGYYRKVFLAFLPYVLSSLQTVETRILAVKTEVKTQLKSADPRTYESLDEQLTTITKAHKDCKHWRGMLKPDSRFHAERNVEVFERHVEAVNVFIRDLPGRLPRGFTIQDIAGDLATGVRGIVNKPQPPKQRPELPTLNTSDLDMY